MRRILFRSLGVFLSVLLCVGAYWGWRGVRLAGAVRDGFEHFRYLLDSGETLEGAPAESVLSDSYLLSLFGNNPELVASLKSVIDLGMAEDETLKAGDVMAMIATYGLSSNGDIVDPAVYIIGGFPDPKNQRLGFHHQGFFANQLTPGMWNFGNSIVRLLGRDIILFCESERAEDHMERLYRLLNGDILALAERIVETPFHYSVVFPEPKLLLPPNLRSHVQTVLFNGMMAADEGKTETVLMTPSLRSSAYVFGISKDMVSMLRVVFHDRFSGYIKEMPWGKMNDMWWSVEGVEAVDELEVIHDTLAVVMRMDMDRQRENMVLKIAERCLRDIAMQKAYQIAGMHPWDFVHKEGLEQVGRYWSAAHKWGPEWPLGWEGLETPKVREERLAIARRAEMAAAQTAQAGVAQ